MVRYCFDPAANIELHFHEFDERSLFFYPFTVAQKDGQWIFAEFRIEGSGVPCLLRGRVYSQDSARFTGSWLEFPVRGVPAVMKDLQGTRRAHERLPIDVTVNLRRGDGTKALSRISDISAAGMRLSGLPFLLNAGEEVSVEILGVSRTLTNLGKGRVVWVRMQEAGLQVAHPDTGQAARQTLLAKAEAFRNTATEQAHPKSCPCRRGEMPPAPPLPKSAARK
jgi:hypothetical protein